MNHVCLVIPTRNRLAKLLRTLSTAPDVPWLHVVIVCDGDKETFDALSAKPPYPRFEAHLLPKHSGSVVARNSVIPQCPDGVLYGVDDCDFLPGCIEAAFAAFNEHFPDDDGVVGICQAGHHNWHPTGVALVGRAFLDRYDGRRLFCPEYYHFAAQEVGWLANKLDRFYQCKEAQIHHYHPGIQDVPADTTHREARQHRVRDRAIRAKRMEEGRIWGSDKP